MSIWNIKRKNRKEPLTGDIAVDTLIVGAGMTGLMTAYHLKKTEDVCIVDASHFGCGVTLNTTAKLTYFQQRIYNQIASLSSLENAKVYLRGQKEAISDILNIIKKEHISCSLEQTSSYVFANTEKEVPKLEKEVQFLKQQGVKVKESNLPQKITSYKTYCVEDTYTFHPLEFLKEIYKIVEEKIPIYENTPIVAIKKQKDLYYCYSPKGIISAKKVVLACHYPFFLFPYFFPIRSSIEKSYIVVSKVLENGHYSCISSGNPVYSCRFYQKGDEIYQISLAESHNTALKQNDQDHFQRVKDIFQLKEEEIVECYSNVDIMTIDFMPYIGKIKDHMYIGTGYNTWGMTNSVLAGKVLADLIEERHNSYATVFSPIRKNVAFYMKLFYHLAVQTKSYVGTKLKKNKSWYSDRVHVYFKNGKSIGVYTDDEGKKHIVYTTCPHMGCSLIFNEKEKTWDCPCHSSRFNIDGKCIKGPSTLDICYRHK